MADSSVYIIIVNPTDDAGQVGLLSSSIVRAQKSSITQGVAVEYFLTYVDMILDNASDA
jgi:hypothetical protein